MTARRAAACALLVGCVVAADYAGRRLDGWPRLAVTVAALATVWLLLVRPDQHHR